MSAIPFPHIWIPRRKLWTPQDAVFTAGKAQRKSDGKLPRKVSTGTAGKTPRNTGADSTCCCTNCDITGQTNCPSGNASGTFLGVVSGTTLLNPCTAVNDCSGGAPSVKEDFGSQTMNGSYCFTGGTDWTFIAISLTTGSSNLAGTCGSAGTLGYLYHLSRLNSTTWVCVGNFKSGASQGSALGNIHFYGTATTSDCSSDFSITNQIVSQACFTLPTNCFGWTAAQKGVALGWNGQIDFVHCGC